MGSSLCAQPPLSLLYSPGTLPEEWCHPEWAVSLNDQGNPLHACPQTKLTQEILQWRLPSQVVLGCVKLIVKTNWHAVYTGIAPS